MFELRIKLDFPAAHHLEGYPGDCSRPHGHNWGVEVFAKSRNLDSIGIAIDFRDLKNATKELVAVWDHQDLNTLPDFKTINPSAEQIAKLAFDRLSEKLDSKTMWIDRVVIHENERCYAAYNIEGKRSQ